MIPAPLNTQIRTEAPRRLVNLRDSISALVYHRYHGSSTVIYRYVYYINGFGTQVTYKLAYHDSLAIESLY